MECGDSTSSGQRLQDKAASMTCRVCRLGETGRGLATVTLERDGTVILVRGVPASICEDCAEYYLDSKVATQAYALAEDAVRRRAEVEIVRYAA